MSDQIELPLPIYPPRVTLDRARELRDQLTKLPNARNPEHAPDVTAIALQFRFAEPLYHTLHSGWNPPREGKIVPFVGKRGLHQLREIALFISALERKRHASH